MHRMCLLVAVFLGGLGLGAVWAADLAPVTPNSPCGPSYRPSALAAEACGAPMGYNLSPGCCECPPCACDNAWDGYCDQKARWQAFWARLGTPKPPRCATYGGVPTPAAGDCRRLPPIEATPANASPPANGPTPIPAAPAVPAAPILEPGKPAAQSSWHWQQPRRY